MTEPQHAKLWLGYLVVSSRLRECPRKAQTRLATWAKAWAAYERGDAPAPHVPYTVRRRVPGAAGRPPYACTASSFVAWCLGEPVAPPREITAARVAA